MSAFHALLICALAFAGGLLAQPAAAQEGPGPKCIASGHAALGEAAGVRAECNGSGDCMYQAPAANGAALALLNAVADEVQECWRKAGLPRTKEERHKAGVIRIYAKGGQTCRVLLSLSQGTVADGFRATCQSDGR